MFCQVKWSEFSNFGTLKCLNGLLFEILSILGPILAKKRCFRVTKFLTCLFGRHKSTLSIIQTEHIKTLNGN